MICRKKKRERELVESTLMRKEIKKDPPSKGLQQSLI